MHSVADVVAAAEALWDPRGAEDWDAVGLVCGDPAADVRRVLVAVDPVAAVVDEAVAGGFDLLLTHHPLYLRGTTSVAAITPKGRLIHRLIGAGIALHVAHTNADVADPGVSDALADVLGLVELTPLVPEIAETPESRRGLGRIGRLPQPMRFDAFVAHVAAALPSTATGVRAAGAPDRRIERVAVCGGSGDSLLATVRTAKVDAFVTADLRHHPASEALADAVDPRSPSPALVDPGHWASEWPWVPEAARRLAVELASRGTTVEVVGSRIVTDPWTTAASS